MPEITCFFLERTGRQRLALRRYHSSSSTANKCPLPMGYHNASTLIGEREERLTEKGYVEAAEDHPHDDPRWPTCCGCGYQFTDDDEWQLFQTSIYCRVDTGEEMDLRDAPAGAMWYADWLTERGPDGHCLMVKTPGGEWCVDGRCSNCMRPNEVHKCWPRRGDVPNVTVDKSFGETCSAGAGSVVAGSYHGFLRGGKLVDA